MRAIVCRAFGSFDTLALEDDVPPPPLAARGVRIAVHAAGMQFADSLMVAGTYQRKPPFPFVPGLPVAGVVTEIADGVTRIAPGDRVFAMLDNGAYAEEAVAPADNVVRIPDEMAFATALAFPFGYGTSYGALTWCARLAAGETLLVHGAAGAVGLAAVEIGKARGCTVIATAGSAEKQALARAHGADHALGYDFRDAVQDLTKGRGADVIYDPVGGETFDRSLRCVAPEGRIVVIGFAGGRVQQIPANLLLVKNAVVIGFFWAHYRKNHPDWVAEGFRTMFDWTRQGVLRPEIGAVLPLAEFKAGMDLILSRCAVGTVVLDVGREGTRKGHP